MSLQAFSQDPFVGLDEVTIPHQVVQFIPHQVVQFFHILYRISLELQEYSMCPKI